MIVKMKGEQYSGRHYFKNICWTKHLYLEYMKNTLSKTSTKETKERTKTQTS